MRVGAAEGGLDRELERETLLVNREPGHAFFSHDSQYSGALRTPYLRYIPVPLSVKKNGP